MLIAVAGMNHRSAPVELREKVAYPPCAARDFLRRLREEGTIQEGVLISTCNRTELFAVIEDESVRPKIFDSLAEDRGLDLPTLEQGTYWHTDAEAVQHLYRVAASLDSMVIGESQILGQVRDAYRVSTGERCTGPILDRLFHTALRIGKDVRTETGVGDSSISVPNVAVKLAEEVFGSLAGRRALVLGAGEMSELVIKHLKARDISELRVSNRTAERARLLAERVGGKAVEFEALAEQLTEVDVVVSSTGSGEWIVNHDLVAGAIPGREDPLFFVDIAVPRDVDPAVQNLGGVYVYDIDDLQSVVDHNTGDRLEAAEKGEAMIGPAVFEYMSWLSTLHVVPLIKELRDGAERIRRHELARAVKRMDLSPEETETVERMSHSIVNKLLHGPISDLKSRAPQVPGANADAGKPSDSEEIRRRLLDLEGLELELLRANRTDTR
ncbi:MAG: glutamyl-tRNA reductase [Rubrobacteraceae bacterium]